MSSNQTINEPTGPIANDSLAAESYNQGGGFASNPDGRPNDVSGSSATWNTTDTSGAHTLASAPDAPRRNDDADTVAGGKYPEALGGQGSFSGKHNAGEAAYVGGPSAGSTGAGAGAGAAGSGATGAVSGGSGGYADASDDTSTADTTGTYSGSGADSYGSAGVAPNYALNPQGAFQGTKAKGANITEGGFEGEGTNYASGIGTSDDPGRAAVQGFAKKAAKGEPNGPAKVGGPDDEQPFGVLGGSERA